MTIQPHLRSWSWAFAGLGLQVVAQAASFFLLARSLPVGDLGLFVSLTAVTSILSPFVGMGASNLLIKSVSREEEDFAERWGNVLLTGFATGSLLCAVGCFAGRLILPQSVPLWEIASVVISDLILFRLVGLAALAFQGLGLIHRMSQLNVFMSCSKLAASMALLMLPQDARRIGSWLLLYVFTAAIVSAGTLLWSSRSLGRPAFAHFVTWKDLQAGFWFAISPSTQTINNDADKVLLARLSSLSDAGMYGAAYRILSASFLPIQALLTVTYPHFFRKGSRGIRHTSQYAFEWLPLALSYSVAVSILLFAEAPAVARILGPSYAQTATVLRYLAVLPILKTLQYFFADSLTGADYQAARVTFQALAAGLNIVLNLLWIPRYGWTGAVWATLVCDGALACMLSAATLWLRSTSTLATHRF